MAAGNSSYTAAITRTLQNFGNEIFDAVSTNNALLWFLKRAGNIKVSGGGRTFTHPVLYGTNTSFKSYGATDTISTPDPDIITRAEYNIKIIAGSIVISTLEEAQNQGKEALIKLAEEKKMEAVVSMSEVMGDQVFNAQDGTGDDFNGLRFLINGTPSTQTNVGGINPSTSGNDYWRNQVDTNTVTAFNTSSEGLTAMDSMLNSCTFGRQGPRAIFTTKAVWSLYQVGQAANIRYAHKEVADAGFKSLDYAGIPVLFDDNCPASGMYFVDTDALWLQVLRRGNNQITQFRPSVDQLIEVALMYLFGNLTCGSRRTQGVITTITG